MSVEAARKLENELLYTLHRNIGPEEVAELLRSPYFSEAEISALPDAPHVMQSYPERFGVVVSAADGVVALGGIALKDERGIFGCYVSEQFRRLHVMLGIHQLSVKGVHDYVCEQRANLKPDPVMERLGYLPRFGPQYIDFIIKNNSAAMAAAKKLGYDVDEPVSLSVPRNEITVRWTTPQSYWGA